jgi:hypothetical protein
MQPTHKHSYNEIIHALLNNKDEAYFLNYIKSNDFNEDELAGLKLFLENNNYNTALLKDFLNPPDFNTTLKPLNVYTVYYKIAASIILLITVGVFTKLYFFNQQTLQNYWVQDTGFKVLMGNENKRTSIANGMSFYKAQQFKEAITEFSFNHYNDTAIYYSGICFIKMNELDSAEKYLQNVPQTSHYKIKSMYYLALSYLFNNKQNQALHIFNTTDFDDNEMELKKKLILNEYKAK